MRKQINTISAIIVAGRRSWVPDPVPASLSRSSRLCTDTHLHTDLHDCTFTGGICQDSKLKGL